MCAVFMHRGEKYQLFCQRAISVLRYVQMNLVHKKIKLLLLLWYIKHFKKVVERNDFTILW